MRARLLLRKQDQLSELEKSLEEIDSQESCPLFLGMTRCDRNEDRNTILSKIDRALVDYGMILILSEPLGD
jgi:hypothetical protein